jgi:hypothetical protein
LGEEAKGRAPLRSRHDDRRKRAAQGRRCCAFATRFLEKGWE